MSFSNKQFSVDAYLRADKIAALVADWDAVDDIVDFIMACIADDEVAEAVVEAIKQRDAA